MCDICEEYDDRQEKRKAFLKQHGIKLELGKVYAQESASWSKMQYKIIYVDDHIALGIKVYNQISMKFIGDYELFNINDGTKYQDSRLEYRLLNEVK